MTFREFLVSGVCHWPRIELQALGSYRFLTEVEKHTHRYTGSASGTMTNFTQCQIIRRGGSHKVSSLFVMCHTKETCDMSRVKDEEQDAWNDSEAVQCDTACYTVIQCGTVWCSVPQCVQVAVCRSVLQCDAVCCSVTQCVAV